MPNLHRLYRAGSATIVHAAATPYRERSHFDGQDVLESGVRARRQPTPDGSTARSQRCSLTAARAPAAATRFAVGPDRALAGARAGARFCHGRRHGCRRRPTTRSCGLLDLYRHTDPTLARVLEERMGTRRHRTRGRHGSGPTSRSRKAPAARPRRRCAPISPRSAGAAAAKFLAQADGPRVGALAFDGWDTHPDEGALGGRLADLLGALDGAVAAVEKNMGAAWRETVVAVVTEFGRTARINGTEGTDHGTGTVAAMLAGGAARGRPRGCRLAGRQGGEPGTRASATSRPPPICAPCSRACSASTCASTSARPARQGVPRQPGSEARR